MGKSFGMGMVSLKAGIVANSARERNSPENIRAADRTQPASKFQILLIENRDSLAAPVLSNFMDLMIILLFGLKGQGSKRTHSGTLMHPSRQDWTAQRHTDY
jgi:hypothetical protein